MPDYSIAITSDDSDSLVDRALLEEVVGRVLSEERISAASISLAVVSDAEIHRVNREFLGHDYPTDVISFLLSTPHPSVENSHDSEDSESDPLDGRFGPGAVLEGELIVSRETARREAAAQGWSPQAELLLYVVHGLLHLCGYDDLTDEARPVMRARERELLALWELCPTGLET